MVAQRQRKLLNFSRSTLKLVCVRTGVQRNDSICVMCCEIVTTVTQVNIRHHP